jgi:sortase system peptidoglycan-associated protein
MKHKALLVVLISALNQPLLLAAPDMDSDSHKDTAGFGIGAILGGLIGGPIGAIAGATGGSWLGSRESDTDRRLQQLQGSLDTSTQHINSLQAQIESNRATFEQTLVEEKRAQRQSLLAELGQIRIDLYYTTANARLRSEQEEQLQSLSGLLIAFPELGVHLQGYADSRGSSQSNLQLSEQRLAAVRRLLEAHGVASQRIHLNAWGESRSQTPMTDLEALFYDRRVSIYLSANSEV